MLHQVEGQLRGVQKDIPNACPIGGMFGVSSVHSASLPHLWGNFGHGGCYRSHIIVYHWDRMWCLIKAIILVTKYCLFAVALESFMAARVHHSHFVALWFDSVVVPWNKIWSPSLGRFLWAQSLIQIAIESSGNLSGCSGDFPFSSCIFFVFFLCSIQFYVSLDA